jgi:hypothetical protein
MGTGGMPVRYFRFFFFSEKIIAPAILNKLSPYPVGGASTKL